MIKPMSFTREHALTMGYGWSHMMEELEFFEIDKDTGVFRQKKTLPNPETVGTQTFLDARDRYNGEVFFIQSMSPFFQYFHAETEVERAGFMEIMYAQILQQNNKMIRQSGMIPTGDGHIIGTSPSAKVKQFEQFRDWFRTVADIIAKTMNL